MPIPLGMVTHGINIKGGVDTCHQPGFGVKQHVIAPNLGQQGKVKITAGHVQIVDRQILKCFRLQVLPQEPLGGAKRAEQTKPGEVL